MLYSLIRDEEGANLTVFTPDDTAPKLAHSSHPNFEEIVKRVLADDATALDLFDLALTAGTKFEKLTERISVTAGRLYFDGEEVNNALSEQVVRFVKEGVEDWMPLAKFYENVMANPNEHSREQLYPWILEQNITITDDGMLVGYKGVNADLTSKSTGTAIVNGEVIKGAIPNPIGAVVEMPRTEVMHNPKADCDAGLHVGSFEYADGFGPTVLEVHLNPRDVVSVPDASWKLRTCRYTVVKKIKEAYTTAVKPKVKPKVKPSKGVLVKMPSIKLAKEYVKKYGSVDEARHKLNVVEHCYVPRDAFRAFCRDKNIKAVK